MPVLVISEVSTQAGAIDDEQTGAMENAISYHRILPPSWCSLPSDAHLYPRPQPIEGDPLVFGLDSDLRCACGAEYDAALPISRVPCVIYGLSKTIDAEIEIQHCPSCDPRRRQSIGPDLRECGLFNWSNQIIFTHDLLDDYTSAYSTSETPFSAWVSAVCNRYQTYASRCPFVSVGLLRSAWFAFVQLQEFTNDMACDICGPNPETVIWDGVTVAFSKKKLVSSIQPPTTTSPHSPSRDNIRYFPNQQLIADREIRQLVLKALVSHERVGKQYESTEISTGEVERSTMAQGDDRAETLQVAEEKLGEINAGMGEVFARKLGSKCGSIVPAAASLELFRQVSDRQLLE